jgi:hypothetical protein
MNRAITWRAVGTRGNGARCTILEVTEYDCRTWANAVPRQTYVLVDHEPADRIAKGRYRILPSEELVTCDHPDAP